MILLLRTLTEKSRMGFGAHSLMTVEEMFLCGHEGSLIAAYYNNSNITFTEKILGDLQITEKITKPGKDESKTKEALKAFFSYKNSIIPFEQRMREYASKKAFVKRMYKGTIRESLVTVRRSTLKAINQGHLKFSI